MKAALRMAVAFGLGCASIWLLYTVLYHVNPFEVVATGSRLAFESTTGNRSYALWLVWNLIDFATFLSLPIVLLLIINLVRSRSVGLPRSIWPLTVATFTTLILLDLSGSVRGEVGRLWIYFGPLFVLIALAGNQEVKLTENFLLKQIQFFKNELDQIVFTQRREGDNAASYGLCLTHCIIPYS